VHREILEVLVDPVSRTEMVLEVYQQGKSGEILEGQLRGESGRTYPVNRGIPRFTTAGDENQKQTSDSFGFKWGQRHTYESPQVHAIAQRWLLQRYGFTNVDEMRGFFARRRRILDAGCGSGFSASLWMKPSWRGAAWIGIDISTAIDVAREQLGSIEDTHFIQADILHLPFLENSFDTVFAEGVLHHTPSTELALKSLLPLIEPGGEILFYVYRKKGAIREFSDDYIRSTISCLDPQEGWNRLRSLTELGKSLAELHADVEVREDIPYLGIKAGRHDVQRLIYWHFAKLFWNEDLSFEENHHVNFDWYHPRYAHRHTEEEVRNWCDSAGLTIRRFDAQESGFTVRAVKG